VAGEITNPRARTRVLAGLAQAAARAGDLDRAGAVAGEITNPDEWALADLAEPAVGPSGPDRAETETVARSITSPYGRALALAGLVMAASSGELKRARMLAEWAKAAAAIPDPDRRARVLGGLAEAAVGAGDLDRARMLADRAEAAATTIPNPDQRARALATLAGKAAPKRARSLLAQALTAGHWEASVVVLAQINPPAVSTIADEYLNGMSFT
jgi:hypothetical protein